MVQPPAAPAAVPMEIETNQEMQDVLKELKEGNPEQGQPPVIVGKAH